MPLILAILIGALIGGGLALLRALLEGIQIAVLGVRGTGKTTLINQLAGQGHRSNTPATTHTENYRRIVVRHRGFKVVLHHVADLSGGRAGADVWAEWERNAKRRDLVFYLVNAEILQLPRYQRILGRDWNRVVRDIEQLTMWHTERANADPFYAVIVTHRDLDTRFTPGRDAEYHDQLKEDLAPLLSLLTRGRTEVYSVNLTDTNEVKDLVVQIINRCYGTK